MNIALQYHSQLRFRISHSGLDRCRRNSHRNPGRSHYCRSYLSVGRYLFQAVLHPEVEERYRQLRLRLGRTLLLGLKILVAADIVRTVALEATLESVIVLGLLVLIRTFLSWTPEVEIEGRWPWQAKQKG